MSASVAPECNGVKERYDSCFLKWYSESKSLGTPLKCVLIVEQSSCVGRQLRTTANPSSSSIDNVWTYDIKLVFGTE